VKGYLSATERIWWADVPARGATGKD